MLCRVISVEEADRNEWFCQSDTLWMCDDLFGGSLCAFY